MKKINLIMLTSLISLSSMLTGCGSVDVPSEGSIGDKFTYVFEKGAEEGKTCDAITKDFVSAKISKYALKQYDVSGTYLEGFKKPITSSYTDAKLVKPKVNGIPFIAYVFTSDNPEALYTDLTTYADLAFQICAIADYQTGEVCGNYVFYMMYSNEQ